MSRALTGEAWMTKAWCPQVMELPWTAEPDRVSFAGEVAMAAVCANCPVWTDCDAYVTKAGITSGFWAGAHRDPTAERTRRVRLRARSRTLGGAA
jgi:hypothetical protein